jgi:dTDP-glucose pyrophosphorylase
MKDIYALMLRADCSIREAEQLLHNTSSLFSLIIDENEHLIGLLKDEDLRYASLIGVDFEQKVSEIMTKKCLTVSPQDDDQHVFSQMIQSGVEYIPVIQSDGRLVGVKYLDDLSKSRPYMEAFIFAGGLGTRLYPITQDIPKPLVQVGGQELLFQIINNLLKYGTDKITLALNYKGDMIEKAVTSQSAFRGRVVFLHEPKQLGTAGALSLLKDKPSCPLLVMNADILTKLNYRAFLRYHQSQKNDVTVTVRRESLQIPYGVSTLVNSRITKIEEKPKINIFVNAGVYILEPSIIDLIPKDSPCDMPDFLQSCIANGYQLGAFPVHEYWMDIGRHAELKKANAEFKDNFG